MKKSQVVFLAIVLVGLILLTNLTYLPGPAWLNKFAGFWFAVGQIFGLFGIFLIPLGLWMTAIELKKTYRNSILLFFLSLLWSVPLAILISTLFLTNTFRNWSRTKAIYRAEKLIESIEYYNNDYGSYPVSLDSLQMKQPESGIIGIPSYEYRITDDSYRLSFTQRYLFPLNFEVVVYDKNDLHESQGEISELHETGIAHWKYYVFD